MEGKEVRGEEGRKGGREEVARKTKERERKEVEGMNEGREGGREEVEEGRNDVQGRT